MAKADKENRKMCLKCATPHYWKMKIQLLIRHYSLSKGGHPRFIRDDVGLARWSGVDDEQERP